jgi:hypothetical protein
MPGNRASRTGARRFGLSASHRTPGTRGPGNPGASVPQELRDAGIYRPWQVRWMPKIDMAGELKAALSLFRRTRSIRYGGRWYCTACRRALIPCEISGGLRCTCITESGIVRHWQDRGNGPPAPYPTFVERIWEDKLDALNRR